MEERIDTKYEIKVKKSTINAKSIYDYSHLTRKRPNFLKMSYEEKAEEIIFTWDTENLFPLKDLDTQPTEYKLSILLSALSLNEQASELKFSLEPSNLFYDRNHSVYVSNRDIYDNNVRENIDENFLNDVKALVGAIFSKLSYTDLIKGGGLSMIKNKSKFLKQIFLAENLKELERIIISEYDQILFNRRYKKVELNKIAYKRNRWYAFVVTAFLISSLATLGFLYYYERPLDKATLAAYDSFVEADFVRVIDSMEPIDDINRFNQPQKYILALSYIRAESLTAQQKDNILSAMTTRGDDSLKNFWIYLGKNQIEDAKNIALQRSDEELLLYALLKEKNIVENNAFMPGDEKAERLSSLNKQINDLAEKYVPSEQ